MKIEGGFDSTLLPPIFLWLLTRCWKDYSKLSPSVILSISTNLTPTRSTARLQAQAAYFPHGSF